MKVSGQLHVPGDLHSGKEAPLPSDQKLVGPRAGMDIPSSARNKIIIPQLPSLKHSHLDYANLAPYADVLGTNMLYYFSRLHFLRNNCV